MNVACSTALVPFQTDIKSILPFNLGHAKAKRERNVIVRDSNRPEHEQEMTFLEYGSNNSNGEYGPTGNMLSRKIKGRQDFHEVREVHRQ